MRRDAQMRGHAAPQDIGIIDGRIAAWMGREEEVVIDGRLVLPCFVIPTCISRGPACSAVAAVSGRGRTYYKYRRERKSTRG